MITAPVTLPLTDRPALFSSARIAIFAWILTGLFLLFCAYPTPVTRTQEARVLETAREMLGQPWRGWMVPHTNGAVRLRKPPLAYWLSAGSFKLFGVSGWAGRVPAVFSAWGTLAFTFLIARRLFDPRVAWLSTTTLLGSYLFMKFMLLGETDTLATLFVTGGVYAAMRCFDASRRARWQHLMAVCIAMAILAKGPVAAFVAIFLVLLCAISRDWWPVREFFKSGAIATLLILALPWFIYVLFNAPGGQLGEDFVNSAGGGEGHSGSPLKYAPQLIIATLPWTAAALVALSAAFAHTFMLIKNANQKLFRIRRRVHLTATATPVLTVLLWCGAIALPLAGWGNKQLHYLLPLMPAAMVMLGWALDRAIGEITLNRTERWMHGVLWAMLGILSLTPIGVVIAVRKIRGSVQTEDVVLIAILAALTIGAVIAAARSSWTSRLTGIIALSIGAMFAATIWAATLSRTTPDDVVAILHKEFPNAEYVFRGPEHLPTCFALRQIIPVMADDAQLAERAKTGPIVCLERASAKEGVTPIPGFRQVRRIDDGANFLSISVPENP